MFGPVLVTGGTGYIGSTLVRLLRELDADVRVLSRQRPADDTGATYVEGDVSSLADIRAAVEGVSVVFHLAGQTSIRAANDNPHRDFDVNVGSMTALLRALAEAGRPAIVINAGTVTQSGLQAGPTIDESCDDRPVTIYDIHKLTAERRLELATREGLVLGVTLRLANVYGPGPNSKASDRGVLNQMIRNGMAAKPLTIFGDGEYLRDYVCVLDVCDAFVKAAQQARQLAGRHFLIGTGTKRTFASAVRTVADQVRARKGQNVPVTHLPLPTDLSAIDLRSYVVDSSRFREATGWVPTISLEQGINMTIDTLS